VAAPPGHTMLLNRQDKTREFTRKGLTAIAIPDVLLRVTFGAIRDNLKFTISLKVNNFRTALDILSPGRREDGPISVALVVALPGCP